jgi:hypothetical protein
VHYSIFLSEVYTLVAGVKYGFEVDPYLYKRVHHPNLVDATLQKIPTDARSPANITAAGALVDGATATIAGQPTNATTIAAGHPGIRASPDDKR